MKGKYRNKHQTGHKNINAVLEDIVDWATHHDYGFISVDCHIRHGVYLDELIEYIQSIYVDEVEK